MSQTFIKFLLVSLILSFCISCKTNAKLFAKGGSEFEVGLKTDSPNKEEVFKRAISRIEKLSSAVGAYIEVQTIPDNPDEIIVRVYEKEKIEEIKKLLFTNYILEIKKVVSPNGPNPLAVYLDRKSAQEKVKANEEVFPYLNAGVENFLIVEKDSILTGEDIIDASLTTVLRNNPAIKVVFNDNGENKIKSWSEKNINSYIATILNKKVTNTAIVKGEISKSVEIYGHFTKNEAENIVLNLKNGQIPITYVMYSEKVF